MMDAKNENTVVDFAEETAEMNDTPAMPGKGLENAVSFGESLRSAAIFYVAKKLNNPSNTFSKTVLGASVKSVANVAAHVEIAKMGCDFITSLAQKIDRFLMSKTEEAPAEEPVEVDQEEPAVEAFAAVEPVEPVESDDDDDDEDSLPEGLASLKLDYIDVMENPEAYQEMLAQEARGEVQLVTRYRRSFMSRMIQSQGNVQDYYNEIKNLLLSYKGVKGRVSWGNESFNRGRSYIAKVTAKTKTLYVYLAIDPTTLEDATYEVVDVSSKKKYAAVPALIKVRGDRKFKFVLDLIRKICEEDMTLPPVKDFAPVDYHMEYNKTEELVQQGLVKKFVAAIPIEK